MAKIPEIQFVRYRFCCLVGGNYPEGFLSKLRSQKGIPSICATKIFSKHLFLCDFQTQEIPSCFFQSGNLSMSYITGWNPEKKHRPGRFHALPKSSEKSWMDAVALAYDHESCGHHWHQHVVNERLGHKGKLEKAVVGQNLHLLRHEKCPWMSLNLDNFKGAFMVQFLWKNNLKTYWH